MSVWIMGAWTIGACLVSADRVQAQPRVTSPYSVDFSEVTAMPVADEEEAAPDALALDATYPNPFATQTTLAYTLPTAQEACLVVYDLLGREVAVLVDDVQPAGTHEATLDAARLPSGVYVVRLATEAGARTRRVVVAR